MNQSPYEVTRSPLLSFEFILRRLHSFLGFFLVLFLFEHMLTNSQAALFIGDDGRGFINGVEFLHSLPYLPMIEIGLLFVPFFIHSLWGVIYLFRLSLNSFPSDGSRPALWMFSRNHAYTWQRISAVVILIFLFYHVYNMRFHRYPYEKRTGAETEFFVAVKSDEGIRSVAARLDAKVLDKEAVSSLDDDLRFWHLADDEVLIQAPNFGTATLFNVRDAFRSTLMAILYSLFVIASAFHALNGLWTFCITWGITLNEKSRRFVRTGTTLLMGGLIFFGLSAIWLTLRVNLAS